MEQNDLALQKLIADEKKDLVLQKKKIEDITTKIQSAKKKQAELDANQDKALSDLKSDQDKSFGKFQNDQR